MADLKTSIQTRWRLIVTLSLFFIFALIIQDLIREVIVFNRDLNLVEQELFNNVKKDVKALVYSTNEEFQFIISNVEDNIVLHAQDNISGLVFAAESITSLHQELPLTELQADIIELAKSYNNTDADQMNHQYYVYNTDGVELLNGLSNLQTNSNQYTQKDYLNREYIKTLIDSAIISETNDSAVNYFLYEDGIIEEYYIYAKHIENADVILASYVKLSSFVEHEKLASIDLLGYVHDNEQNNVYIISRDGEILFHQNPDAIGLSVNDENYPVWTTTIRAILDFVDDSDEGFLEYEFYSNYANGVVKDKVAYIKYIEEWDIIIGASSDVDIYGETFSAYRADNYQAVLMVKIPSYIIIFTLGFFIFMYIKNNVKLSQSILIEEEHLYRKFADLTSEIILITDKQGEIVFTNKVGKMNIFGQRDDVQKIYFDQILVEEEGYYILYGIKEDLFVKFVTEEVEYNNQPADLYIIMDVTEKIRTERKLEALSMKDELTGLGNRRMMVRDYNEEILPFVKNGGTAHLAMLDLDDFKPANDLYGHSYGDQVLQDISKIFNEFASEMVQFYRIGGDEFSIIFKNFSEVEIKEFVLSLQQKIGHYPYEKEVQIGFSVGVATIQVDDQRRRFSDFFDRADKLLYKSKAEGKNTINF